MEGASFFIQISAFLFNLSFKALSFTFRDFSNSRNLISFCSKDLFSVRVQEKESFPGLFEPNFPQSSNPSLFVQEFVLFFLSLVFSLFVEVCRSGGNAQGEKFFGRERSRWKLFVIFDRTM